MLKRVLFVGVLLLCATPATAKDLVVCDRKGNCHEGIRPW